MALNQRVSIAYILPDYDPATGSHFFHLYELLRRSSAELDIFLIIERAETCPSDLPLGVYCQKFSWPPLRLAELFFVVLRERMRGRRNFYTHYSFFGGFISWFVARIFGGRAYYWNAGMPWQYRRGFFEETAFRFILNHNILVTGTGGLADKYREHYKLKKENIRIMPNWTSVSRFQDESARAGLRRSLNIPEEARVVLFVHHLSRRKGSHFILPTAEIVTKKLRNVIFVIVGAGPEYEKLKSEIRNSGAENNVRLIGEVPNRRIQDYFAAADVFFMPSEEEGFPHVLLEAMAAGIPYVASDVGAVREITPPELQSFVSEPAVGFFSEKIVELLNKPMPELERIKAIEQSWVRQYDTAEVLTKFAALFA